MMHVVSVALRAWTIVVVCIATTGSFSCHAMVGKNPMKPAVSTTTTTTTGSVSRRTVLDRLPFMVIGATTSVSLTSGMPTKSIIGNCDNDTTTTTTGNCHCWNCQLATAVARSSQQQQQIYTVVVNAYERRDVGDATSSGETKAMNDQAYETNNRLERDGLVLETAAEQSASLTAALSDYSYSPTPGKSNNVQPSSSKGTRRGKKAMMEEPN